MSGHIDHLFPSTVYRADLDDTVAINRQIVKLADAERQGQTLGTPQGWNDEVLTSYAESTDFLSQPACRDLREQILGHVDRYLKCLGYDIPGFTMYKSWVNVFPAGTGHMDLHEHSRSLVSGVYYVQAAEGCGQLYFRTPLRLEVATSPALRDEREVNRRQVNYEPVEGRLILFRGWFEHGVMLNRSQQDRISISFNTRVQEPSSDRPAS